MDRVQKSKLSLYKKTMEVNGRALEQASSDLGPLCVSACWRLCWMSKPFRVLYIRLSFCTFYNSL